MKAMHVTYLRGLGLRNTAHTHKEGALGDFLMEFSWNMISFESSDLILTYMIKKKVWVFIWRV